MYLSSARPSARRHRDAVFNLAACAAFACAGAFPATFTIHPVRPVNELRTEALRLRPPKEKGPFRRPDLVDLATLGGGLHFDIRYASANNFLGVALYSEARAFLERPAALALLAAAKDLSSQGYGLLIHDAYRPWYVTRIFWDATPAGLHTFVADPAKGSKHNRGCAVDLSMYDLNSGAPVEMPSGYDEMTERAHPDYRGGSEGARARRELLRKTMEARGFTIDRGEWWHYDYHDWPRYPIVNIPLERLVRERIGR
jgi:zinc D-Ala-D-Ala dipeptidase